MTITSSSICEQIMLAIAKQQLIVSPEMSVMAAIAMMDKKGASCVVVTGAEERELLGIFTERDLIRICTQSIPLAQLTMQSVMSHPVISIQETVLNNINDVLMLLQTHQIRHLPVLNGDRFMGVLTKDDLAEILAKTALNFDLNSKDFKLAEQENQHLKDRLQFILSTTPAVIFTCKPDGDYGATFISDNLQSLMGYTPEEYLAKSSFWADHLHPDDAPYVFAQAPLLFELGKYSFEYRFQHQDGHYLWIRSEMRVIRNSENIPIEVVGYFADISDRKQAELSLQTVNEELRESNAQLAESISTLERNNALLTVMQEASFDGILVIDEHRRVLTYNQQFIHQWHIPQEIITGGNDHKLLTVALSQLSNPTEFLKLVEHLYENPQKISRDEISFMDGRTFDRYSAPIYWDNKHYGRIWFFRDISDRKRAELSLQQEILRRNVIFNASSDGIHILDAEGHLLEYNDRFAQMLGYTPEEIVSFNIAEWDAQWTLEELRTILQLDFYNDNTFETLHRRKDGSIFPVEISRRAMDWQGESALVCISRDISDRKQAEQDLRESQAFIQKIADASPNILYVSDLQEQRNIYTNREIASVLGYEPELVQAMGTDFFINMLHPDDLQNVFPNYSSRMKAAQDGEVVEVEYRMRHANGEWRWLYSRDIVFSRDADGQVKQVIGIAEDISDRKKYEQQLEQTNAELLRATRLKDEFLATVSHELRTPLNAILGMTESLQDEIFGTINERQITALQTVERSSYHLLELINDILDVAKIEAGQVELNYSSTAIAQLCQSSMLFVKQQALKKDIQLETQIAPNLPDISLDERRIRQALINLLNNAVKFTAEGGQIKLEVDRYEDRLNPHHTSWLRFSIIDTGIGIAPENIQKLFQPFIQIDSTLNRKYEGTGLGLALVKQIVSLHEGKVSLTSKLGVGSCVTVDIPYKNTVLSASKLQPPMNHNLENDDPEQKALPLILIAEDNETNINTIDDYLIAKGYRLIIARNGMEAIAMAKAHHPDIILMDIQMPVMDGLEAIKQIRLDPKLIDVPIIALTALAMTGDRDRCLAAGANEYLSKPVKLKELVATIQKMLGNVSSR